MDYNIRSEFIKISEKASAEINSIIEDELHEIVPRYKEKIAGVCEGRTDKPFNFIDTLVDQHIYQDTKVYLRNYSKTLTSVLLDVANYMSHVAEDNPEQLKDACNDCIKNISDINQLNKYRIFQRIPLFLKPFLRRVIDTYKSVLNSEEEKALSEELRINIQKVLEKDITDMIKRIHKRIGKVIKNLEKDITKAPDFIYDESINKDSKMLKTYNQKLNQLGYSIDETYNSLVLSEPTGKKHKAYIDNNQLKTADNILTISIDKDLIVLYNSQNYYKFITINDNNISIRNNETTISLNRSNKFELSWNKTQVISLCQKYYIYQHIYDFFPTIMDLLLEDPKFYRYYKKCKKAYESNLMFNKKGLNPIREKEVIRRLELLGYQLIKEGKKLKVIDSKEKEHNLIINNGIISFEDNDSIKINLSAISLNKQIEFEYISVDGFKHVLISNANLDHFELLFDNDDKNYQLSIDDEMIIGEVIDKDGNHIRNDGVVINIYNDLYPSITMALNKHLKELIESIPLDIQIKRLEQTQDVQKYLALINKKLKEEQEEQEEIEKS